MAKDQGGARTETDAFDAMTTRPTAPISSGARVHTDIEPDVDSVRYDPRELLGVGGMGEVRECHDRSLGRTVARKDMLGGAEREVRRFLREVRIQAQLEHPSIVPVYDLEFVNGKPRFTMKRVQGITLAQAIKAAKKGDQDPRFSPRRLLSAFATVCLAIDYAHSRGVVHRDLKPANIMLGRWGEVYVLDWGVAVVEGEASDEAVDLGTLAPDLPGNDPVTKMVGTPGYIAPEVLLERSFGDVRTDVYSLGCMLFEVIARIPLHVGSSAERTNSTVDGADVDARLVAAGLAIPPELSSICQRATALEPEERHPSARELHDELERYLDGDRDLELRRDMADALTLRAAPNVDLAVESGQRADRRAALRDLFGALALAPEHPGASKSLVRLLSEPPRHIPPEVSTELERSDAMRNYRLAAPSAATALAIVIMTGFMVWMGVESWLLGGACLVLGVVAPLSVLREGHLERARAERGDLPLSRGRRDLLPLFLVCLMIALSTQIAGPWMLAPAVLAVISMLRVLRDDRQSWIVMTCTAGALVVPALLQEFGLTPPSYVFDEQGMRVLPVLTKLPEPPTNLFFGLCTVASVIAPGLIALKFRRLLRAAQTSVQLHSWQLSQMLPDSAVDASPKAR